MKDEFVGNNTNTIRVDEALNHVIEFSSTMVMRKFEEKTITCEEIEDIKYYCRILSENDIYPFQVDNKSDYEILSQINDFIKTGLKM